MYLKIFKEIGILFETAVYFNQQQKRCQMESRWSRPKSGQCEAALRGHAFRIFPRDSQDAVPGLPMTLCRVLRCQVPGIPTRHRRSQGCASRWGRPPVSGLPTSSFLLRPPPPLNPRVEVSPAPAPGIVLAPGKVILCVVLCHIAWTTETNFPVCPVTFGVQFCITQVFWEYMAEKAHIC